MDTSRPVVSVESTQPAIISTVDCSDQDQRYSGPAVRDEITTASNPHITTHPTHPMLSSHTLSWKGMPALSPSPDAAIVPENDPSPGGAFVINDDSAAPESAKTGRKANKQPIRKPIAKKKKGQGVPPKGSQGVRRGNGVSQSETENLLELLYEHLPLAKDEWEKTARLHELRYPQHRRNADSIRRKFSALCRTVPPTGDPSIPAEVLKAKEIRKAMTERADIGEGDESDDEYTENVQDDIAPFPRAGTPAAIGSNASIVPETLDVDDTALTKARPIATRNGNPSPRPLVRKRTTKSTNDDESIVSAIKASMLQEQMRRDEDYRQRVLEREEAKERREEERLVREQERLDERERRAEERARSQQLTQMMMIALLGPRAREMDNEGGPSKDT